MLSESEQQEIVDYIMSDLPRRLELAVGTYAAFETLRATLIRKFIRELVERVSRTLPAMDGWTVDASALIDQPLDRFKRFRIENKSWEREISVILEAQAYGPRAWWMGVVAPKAYAKSTMIGQRLNKQIGEAQTGDNSEEEDFPWWRGFTGKWKDWRLSDWRQPQAVLALGEGGQGHYANYLHDALVDISRTLDEGLRLGGSSG
jgi:hypothetical protein